MAGKGRIYTGTRNIGNELYIHNSTPGRDLGKEGGDWNERVRTLQRQIASRCLKERPLGTGCWN